MSLEQRPLFHNAVTVSARDGVVLSPGAVTLSHLSMSEEEVTGRLRRCLPLLTMCILVECPGARVTSGPSSRSPIWRGGSSMYFWSKQQLLLAILLVWQGGGAQAGYCRYNPKLAINHCQSWRCTLSERFPTATTMCLMVVSRRKRPAGGGCKSTSAGAWSAACNGAQR